MIYFGKKQVKLCDFQQSYVEKPETARKLGKISGVEALITGTLTPFGEKVRISAKVLDTETADIISSVRGNIAKTQGIEELLSTGISVSSNRNTKSSVVSNRPQNIKVSTDMVSEVDGFEFRLRKCSATGSSLKCFLVVTNLKKDGNLRLDGSYEDDSRIINSFGDEFKATEVELGNYAGTVRTGRKVMPKDIPIKASVTYRISDETSFVNLLGLHVEINGTDRIVQFRNVMIER